MNDLKMTKKILSILVTASLINYMIVFSNIEFSAIIRSVILVIIAGVYCYCPDKMFTWYKYIFCFILLQETFYYFIAEKTLFWNIYQVLVTIGIILTIVFCNNYGTNENVNLLKFGTVLILCAKIINLYLVGLHFYVMREEYIAFSEVLLFFKTLLVIAIETLPIIALFISYSQYIYTEVKGGGCEEYGNKRIY